MREKTCRNSAVDILNDCQSLPKLRVIRFPAWVRVREKLGFYKRWKDELKWGIHQLAVMTDVWSVKKKELKWVFPFADLQPHNMRFDGEIYSKKLTNVICTLNKLKL